MHHSRFSCVIIDCQTSKLDEAAEFWGQALGRAVQEGPSNPRYISLSMRNGEPSCQVQAVTHESGVHLDLETDDIEAEVARLIKLGAQAVERHETWVVLAAPTGQRFCVGRVKSPEFLSNANRWE